MSEGHFRSVAEPAASARRPGVVVAISPVAPPAWRRSQDLLRSIAPASFSVETVNRREKKLFTAAGDESLAL
ncbi:MAG TPA: hypothetical protein DIC50_02100 [Verrucomicrobia subdivision 3 bacterium]|jgi:hypothetical protein|nr:hypothetical protein [Limisphaerales bacterium]